MTRVAISYATPSVFESTRESVLLGLSADAQRPVRFHARVVRDVLALRLALQALGELVWRSDDWLSARETYFQLDPVVTVHPDRVFFEAFSADQSAYGLVIADRDLFEPIGPVTCGTTNVDFTAWLWAALAEMRSSRETTFRVGAEGFEVETTGAGGRYEKKVDVPDEWVRGFLQLSAAMAMPGTRLSVRPVDLLSAIRFLRFTKAKVSPRALRFEMEPGEDAALVLEPWEHRIPLGGASHTYAERRVIRTWGRRRLSVLEPLLPFAREVDVYLKGRAMPSFYSVSLASTGRVEAARGRSGVRFVLGLSGFTSQRWTGAASFDLLVVPGRSGDVKEKALLLMRELHAAGAGDIAARLGLDAAAATGALTALCAEGRCLFDLEARAYRHRELFAEPVDPWRLYPPDPRREAADLLVARGDVAVASAAPRETRKAKRFRTPDGPVYRDVVHRDWVVLGRAGAEADVELVLNDEDRLIFARCGCAFFRESFLAKGPCEHVLALFLVAQPQRKDAASSVALEKEAFEALPRTQGPPAEKPRDTGELDEAGGDGEDS